jgi:hypothetical protein
MDSAAATATMTPTATTEAAAMTAATSVAAAGVETTAMTAATSTAPTAMTATPTLCFKRQRHQKQAETNCQDFHIKNIPKAQRSYGSSFKKGVNGKVGGCRSGKIRKPIPSAPSTQPPPGKGGTGFYGRRAWFSADTLIYLDAVTPA